MKAKVWAAFLLAATSAFATPAPATLITYTETADVSGSLNSVDFTDNVITLTASGDTSSVAEGPPGFFSLSVPVTFTLSGGGSGTFTDEILLIDNQFVPAAGFGDFTTFEPIIYTASSVFATYDLKTAIGPVVGGPINNGGSTFATNVGPLIIDSVSGESTFTATIPEPATWTMMALGFAGLGFAGYRRSRSAVLAV
jgi:hypothetical protein